MCRLQVIKALNGDFEQLGATGRGLLSGQGQFSYKSGCMYANSSKFCPNNETPTINHLEFSFVLISWSWAK